MLLHRECGRQYILEKFSINIGVGTHGFRRVLRFCEAMQLVGLRASEPVSQPANGSLPLSECTVNTSNVRVEDLLDDRQI